jgi:hypothetical protein
MDTARKSTKVELFARKKTRRISAAGFELANS